MFVCQLCGAQPSAAHSGRSRGHAPAPQAVPLPTERERVLALNEEGKKKEHKTNDPGGSGWEIAEQALACPALRRVARAAGWVACWLMWSIEVRGGLPRSHRFSNRPFQLAPSPHSTRDTMQSCG